MKILLILIVVGILNGCQNAHMNGYDVTRPAVNDSPQEQKSVIPPIRELGQNTYAVYDLVSFDGRLIGVGTGIRNTRNTLFEFEKDRSVWRETSFELAKGEINLWAVESLTVVNETLLVALSNGITLRANSLTDQWEQLGKVVSEPTKLIFADEKVGYLIGRTFTGCQIFKTENGGAEWNAIYENRVSGNCFDLEIVDKNIILAAVKDEYLLRSEDAGATWHRMEIEPSGALVEENDWIKLNSNGAADLQVSPNGEVWVVGEKGSIYVSVNRGETWTRPMALPESYLGERFNSITFSNLGTGIAVGDKGFAIATRDFGKSWTELPKDSFRVTDTIGVTNNKLDSLRLVRFLSGTFFILGKHGVYEVLL